MEAKKETTMPSLLSVLRSAKALPKLAPDWRSRYLELCSTDATPLGYYPRRLIEYLHQYPKLFTVFPDKVVMRKNNNGEDLDQFVKDLYAKKVFTGWRNERYALRSLKGGDKPFFTVERASAKIFGAVRQSVHINGFTYSPEGKLQYWMGRRAANKSRFPGMLDNVVAGGLPFDIKPFECAVKECWEEASIEQNIAAQRLKCTGSITRCLEEDDCLTLEEIFIFDMDFSGIQPKPCDGEVECFYSVDNLNDLVFTERAAEVKPDVLLVLADFMIRHGMVDFNQYPADFLTLVRELHRPIPQHAYTGSIVDHTLDENHTSSISISKL